MLAQRKWLKRLLVLLLACSVSAAVLASLSPKPIPVETSPLAQGPIAIVVSGTGKLRFTNKQTVSTPVAGSLLRIAVKPGDLVQQGQPFADLLPSHSALLDPRSRAELSSRHGAARSALTEAQRNLDRTEAALSLAQAETDRTRQLVQSDSIPSRSLDLAQAELQMRKAERDLAKSSVERVRLEAQSIAASIATPTDNAEGQNIQVRAPFSGVVMRVHNENAGPVPPASPLLDIGDPNSLELVVDLPTQSATRVSAGAPVLIDGLGDGRQLAGSVKLIEPAAFTKITALGVEEQRVNVIVVPTQQSQWTGLGDGFAADAHIEIKRVQNALKVPSGAVFRDGSGFAVFCVINRRVKVTRIIVGSRNSDEVEILSGLAPNSIVVVHPSDKLNDGVSVNSE